MVSFQDALAAGKVTTEQAHQLFDSLDTVKPSELRATTTSIPSFAIRRGARGAGGVGVQDESGDEGLYAADPPKATALFLQGAYMPNHQAECETQEPGARLRPVAYRGVVTASMIYNQLPIIDHFRPVDDDTLLGVMDNPQAPGPPYFFVLRRHG
ncbi:uncharacterized protein PG986_006553 [Apiospora aurea]|uniref:DUF4334 domain-containing protein n=1 Tax=Apiospora aurea TaxID=335848 RepID=A0ABR1QKR3_9PEZI